tara:strand:+ start:113 stop:814 length:702 start_codon:yes stop_codon:yes gene_type:complete
MAEDKNDNFNLNSNRWIETLPGYKKIPLKIETVSGEKIKKTGNKYAVTAVLFVAGLIVVSAIKNETRELQKEINSLRTSINTLKLNLHQVTLDHEVITSPENISKLAKENLETEFKFYKKSQIKNLNDEPDLSIESKINKEEKKFPSSVKIKIAKRIEKKKMEIKKLQELYSKPETIPEEVKIQIAKKIKKKKLELNNIYSSPKKVITEERAQRWAVVQVVKTFLGIPIIPGR